LDYSEKGKVKIKMLDYVDKMLADLPAEMDGEAPSPAANQLLTVNDDQIKMNEKKAQFLHTYVAICASEQDRTYKRQLHFLVQG
jgi:hypothetical protein